MARIWTKSEGKVPKYMMIQLGLGGKQIFGPYFSKQSELQGAFKNIEFELCETTGNYIRITPIQDFEKK
jgi:hypothetical protein